MDTACTLLLPTSWLLSVLFRKRRWVRCSDADARLPTLSLLAKLRPTTCASTPMISCRSFRLSLEKTLPGLETMG